MSLIGAQLGGEYKVVGMLGAGAMGEVFSVEHEASGRRAAAKVILKQHADDPKAVRRFLNEARTINAIGHPNIIEAGAVGTIDARPYILLELLDGETLQQRLDIVYRMELDAALHIVLQVADALGAAHQRGFVHRDVKPDNIFLVQRGDDSDYVKMLDFGIAKLFAFDPAGNDAALTQAGVVVGTPHYMSPEQCTGESTLDPRSDLYSLGVVLYRSLTGELPFTADPRNAMKYVVAHVHDPPVPPRNRRPDIPEAIEDVIMTALAKDPSERYANMAELCRALGRAQQPSLPIPRPRELRARELSGSLLEAKPDPLARKRASAKLARAALDRIRNGTLELPVLPQAALQCLQRLRDPDCSLNAIAALIGRDPLLAPQVIREANMALVGGGVRSKTVDQAVSRMGLRQLSTLLIEISARRLFESRNAEIRSALQELWSHSAAVASVARSLGKLARADAELGYLAGLLHDVGKAVAAGVLLEAEEASGRGAEQWHTRAAWLEIVAQCHREIGFALARAWELPDEVLFAIARSDRYSLEDDRSPVNLVCLANAIVKREGIYPEPVDGDALAEIIEEGKQLFGLDDSAIARAVTELHATMKRAER